MVGGTIRDILLRRTKVSDIDLAVPCDGYQLAAVVVDQFGPEATFVPLDKVRGTGRVVIGRCESLELDISSYKGCTIAEDLHNRDFTINAMAVRLDDFLGNVSKGILDPLIINRENRLILQYSTKVSFF